MAYLLGTQALIDSAKNVHTPVHDWAEREDPSRDDVHVSVVSFMVFQAHVDQLSISSRVVWQRLFNSALSKHQPDKLIIVNYDIAIRVAQLRALGLMDDASQPLSDSTLFVLTTAMEEHLMLIDKRRNYHMELEKNHGLSFVDPYE